MPKKKKKQKNYREALKESITHGVFIFNAKEGHEVFCRNTEKYLPLPVKFRELLETKYLECWHIERTIYKYGKKVKMECFAPYPIEFVISHIPEKHLMVMAICHPTIQFKRKSGVRIVKQRMDWALLHPKEERSWKDQLN